MTPEEMQTLKNRRVVETAEFDQKKAELKEDLRVVLADLVRITVTGPKDRTDAKIIHMCMMFTLGELIEEASGKEEQGEQGEAFS